MRLALKFWVCLMLCASGAARAGEPIHGRLQFTGTAHAADAESLDALLGERHRQDGVGDARFIWEPRHGAWDFHVHYQLSADAGDDVRYQNLVRGTLGDMPPATLFDFSSELLEEDNLLVEHQLDRLSVGYSTSHWVVKLGRQALTWGSGKTFQVMDLVAPFAPNTVDTEYKPGVDMIYAQWLFDDGSDLQFAAAPRPQTPGGQVVTDASSVALHYRRSFGELGTTWLLAHHYEYWTAGIGLSGPLKGATWNVEVAPAVDRQDKVKLSLLANVDLATLLLKRNAIWFVEYYRNGYGQHQSDPTYDALPNDLIKAVTRGQVFNLSRNYVSGGMQWEWTPLWRLSGSAIGNLDDHSAYVACASEYSTGDNSSLVVGAQVPFGPKHTEYGGTPLSAGLDTYVAPASTFYVQYNQYF